jgi:hypothetical protein
MDQGSTLPCLFVMGQEPWQEDGGLEELLIESMRESLGIT